MPNVPPSQTPHNEVENLQPIPENEVSLTDFLSILYKKKYFILSVTFIFTLIAFGYSLWKTPTYRVTIGFLQPAEYIPPEKFLGHIAMQSNKYIYNQFLSTIMTYTLQRNTFDKENFFERFTDDLDQKTTHEKEFLKLHNSIIMQAIHEYKQYMNKTLEISQWVSCRYDIRPEYFY